MLAASSSLPDDAQTIRIGYSIQGQTQKWAERNYVLEGKTRVATPLVLNDFVGKRVIVLAGLVSQSNQGNHLSGSYTIQNPTKIYNFSIDNGGYYQTAVPLLGCTYESTTIKENYLPRLADKLLNDNLCDVVVLVPAAVGGTTLLDWIGPLDHVIKATLTKCSRAGLFNIASQFFVLSHIGESDKIIGTSQATYVERANQVYNSIINFPNFNGKIFITQTTFDGNSGSAAIRAAQASLINGTSIFFLGDTDAVLGSTYRDDLLHFNQAGSEVITSEFFTRLKNYINS